MPSRKKVEWVFVFRTPTDLHTFIQIVENLTNPDETLIGKEPRIESKREDSLERRNIEYLNQMGIGPDMEEKVESMMEETKKPDRKKVSNEENDQQRIKKKVEIIKDKVFEQRKNEEALMLEEKKMRDAKSEIEQKALKEQKDIQQFAWKINYNNFMREYSTLDGSSDKIYQNGNKIVKLISKFKANTSAKFREIVDELCFPQNIRKNKPVSKAFSEESNEDSSLPIKLIFKDENYQITISIPEECEKVFLKDRGFNPFVIDETAVELTHSRGRILSWSSWEMTQ